MIERIDNLPTNVLGFAATGTVTSKDYESVIIPAVEEMLSRQNKVRFLYHLGPEFSGFEAGAMWDDAKIGLKHFTSWEKIAVITDVEWIRLSGNVFGLLMPAHVRMFHNSELAEAKAWIVE